MTTRQIAAVVYSVLTAIVVAFQIALFVGAPWGAYAMGGIHPDQLPTEFRVGALVQGIALTVFAVVVLARAGLGFGVLARPSRWMIWGVVVICAVSSVLNLITPMAGERLFWAPVALTLLATSVIVATGPKGRS